jgi:hypothetical protein
MQDLTTESQRTQRRQKQREKGLVFLVDMLLPSLLFVFSVSSVTLWLGSLG